VHRGVLTWWFSGPRQRDEHGTSELALVGLCVWEGNLRLDAKRPGLADSLKYPPTCSSAAGNELRTRIFGTAQSMGQRSGSAFGEVTVGTDPRVHVQLL